MSNAQFTTNFLGEIISLRCPTEGEAAGRGAGAKKCLINDVGER